MSVKGTVRYIIALVIAWLVLSFALPAIGIARSKMLPPPIAYSSSAIKTTEGYITGKHTEPSSNIFHSDATVYLVDYQFRADSVPGIGFGGAPPKEKTTVYKGRINVDDSIYESYKVNQVVPVRYDPTNPEISAVTGANGGRNGMGGGFILGQWIIWWIVALALAYMLSPWLERIFLRESY